MISMVLVLLLHLVVLNAIGVNVEATQYDLPTPVGDSDTSRRRAEDTMTLTTTLLDVDFDNPANTSGFDFTRDMFVDGDDQYTIGYYVGLKGRPDPITGATTAGLLVRLGGVNGQTGMDMSAGFRYFFTTTVDYIQATLDFDYQVDYAKQYDAGEHTTIMVGIDGSGVFDVDFFDNSSPTGLGQWKEASVDLGPLAVGMHYFDIGGINNLKTHGKERTIFYLDNIRLTGIGLPTTITLLESDFTSDAGVFTYQDDTFSGTSQPNYAKGLYDNGCGKLGGGCVYVKVGGVNNKNIDNMSGGWVTSFSVPSDTTETTVSFDYRVDFTNQFEPDEYAEVLVSLGGALVGLGGFDYIGRFVGGVGGSVTEYERVSLDLGPLSAGTYTLSLGAFLNRKTSIDESAFAYFDGVVVSAQANGGAAQPSSAPTPETVSSALFSADFAFDAEGFLYEDDAFYSTSQPTYASGLYQPSGGILNSGCLDVKLGGINNKNINFMSGGWSKEFSVSSAGEVVVVFDFQFVLPSTYDAGEFAEVLVAVDGTLVGLNGNSYVSRLDGGNGGFNTPYEQVSIDLGFLSSGTHTLVLGGYNNRKTTKSEQVTIRFDDITASVLSSTAAPVSTSPPSPQPTPPPTPPPTPMPVPAGPKTIPPSYTPLTILQATFGADVDGFAYQDDPWGLARRVRDPVANSFADGVYTATEGEGGGGGLKVSLGGISTRSVYLGMAGGFSTTFSISRSGYVTVSFSYRVHFSADYDVGEYSEVLCIVNGELVGTNGNDYVDFTDKDGGHIPWTMVTLDVGVLQQGSYDLILGGYNNQKTHNNEFTDLFFDNVVVTAADPPSLSPSTSGAPTYPSPQPSSAPAWVRFTKTEISSLKNIDVRHEACFVMVQEKGYLIGGRGNNPVDIYDPSLRQWSIGTGPGFQVHHMQCVAVDDAVFIVSSWTGGFPRENNVDAVLVYNTTTDSWDQRTGLPEARRRGSGASVLVDREIYVLHGNRGGHGSHGTTLGWVDKYNVDTDSWTMFLADAPNPRDHTGGALMADGRICVAGGRDGGSSGFFNNVVLQTDCYNPATNTWTVEANIPQGRAGSAYGTTCDGKLMIAGGEGFGIAFDEVDVFDGTSWKTIDSLNQARHGTGLAISCTCDQIHIVSGSGAQGGSPELRTLETLFPSGVDVVCPDRR